MKKIVRLALFIGGAALVARLVEAKKSQWHGLTEAEVRQKLDARLPGQVPQDKRAAIADQVVSKMRQRGALSEEESPEATADEATDELSPNDP